MLSLSNITQQVNAEADWCLNTDLPSDDDSETSRSKAVAATAATATPEHQPLNIRVERRGLCHNSIDAENERTKPGPARRREGTWTVGVL